MFCVYTFFQEQKNKMFPFLIIQLTSSQIMFGNGVVMIVIFDIPTMWIYQKMERFIFPFLSMNVYTKHVRQNLQDWEKSNVRSFQDNPSYGPPIVK